MISALDFLIESKNNSGPPPQPAITQRVAITGAILKNVSTKERKKEKTEVSKLEDATRKISQKASGAIGHDKLANLAKSTESTLPISEIKSKPETCTL